MGKRLDEDQILRVLHKDAYEFLENAPQRADIKRRAKAERGLHLDQDITSVGTGHWFAEELTSMFEETLRATVPEPNAFEFFELDDTSAAEGAKSYEQKIREGVGEADWIDDGGHSMPRVDVVQRKISRDIKPLGTEYGWDVFDLMAAQMNNQALDEDLGVEAREAIQRKHNRAAWWGAEEYEIWGLLNHPRIPRFLFSNTIDSTTSGNTIIAELVDYAGVVEDVTDTAVETDTLLLPPQEFRYIMNTEKSSGSEARIADWILDGDNGIDRIRKAWELKPEYNDGQALAVVFRSGRRARYVAPLVFRQMPAQRDDLEFKIQNIGKSGGFYAPRPMELVVGELKR